MMRFPNDVVALFDCGTSLPNRDELEAIGTEGSLFLDDPWHCGTPVIELRRNDSVERIEVEAANPYRLELEDLNAAIRGERAPLLGREDAMGQVRAIDALFRSHEAGRLGDRSLRSARTARVARSRSQQMRANDRRRTDETFLVGHVRRVPPRRRSLPQGAGAPATARAARHHRRDRHDHGFGARRPAR